MTLSEIRRGEAVFLDANVLIYHFAERSHECSAFLARVERGDFQGLTGQTVVLEVAHRLMTLEAAERGLTGGANPAARLARTPDLVKQLSKYYFAAQKIPDMQIEVLRLPEAYLTRSQEYRQTHGLLVNDSLVPMYMREAGVTLLASADSAFDRVSWIRRASPSDI